MSFRSTPIESFGGTWQATSSIPGSRSVSQRWAEISSGGTGPAVNGILATAMTPFLPSAASVDALWT